MKKILYSRLSGGLGNNLFIYCNLKLLSHKNSCSFFYIKFNSHLDLNFYIKFLKNSKKNILNILKNKKNIKEINIKQKTPLDISTYFQISLKEKIKNFLLFIYFSISNQKVYKIYQNNNNFNLFDNQNKKNVFYELKTLQSFKLINKNRDKVLNFIKLSNSYKNLLKKIDISIPFPKNMRCCVHIRRGDYLWQDKGYKYKDQGWVLPKKYYLDIIKKLPNNIFYIFITDDYEYVIKEFAFLKNKIVMKDNPDPVDLYLFSICKYNIAANSTFSIWGSWINNTKDKHVFAPKYNIGWHKYKWYPEFIKIVSDNWQYIEINDN